MAKKDPPKELLAHHRCKQCGLETKRKPGPHPDCLRCGSVYFDWLNYNEFKLS